MRIGVSLALAAALASFVPAFAQQSAREIYERNADILGIPPDQRHPPSDDSVPPSSNVDSSAEPAKPADGESEPFKPGSWLVDKVMGLPARAGKEVSSYGRGLLRRQSDDDPSFAPLDYANQTDYASPDSDSPSTVIINSYVEYPSLPLFPGSMSPFAPIGTGGFLPGYPGVVGASPYPQLGAGSWSWVQGYVRSDGTYVAPHWQQGPAYPAQMLPQAIPFSYQPGWNRPASPGWPGLTRSNPYGRTQQVSGYTKTTGTVVQPYNRRPASR